MHEMRGSLPSRPDVLDPFLYDVLRQTGAYAGGVFLLLPDEPVLGLAVTCGMPGFLSEPWRRFGLDQGIAPGDAVRERRVIWLPVGRTHAPTVAASALAPYPFASASAPLSDGDTVWGALTLLFPAAHPAVLSSRQRAAIDACCGALGRLLADAAAEGRPVVPEDEPHQPPPTRTDPARPAEAAAAVDFAERLPEGGLALDGDGRVAFATPTAAELMDVTEEELRGRRLWDALPWLSGPVFEERYRAALFSRESTAFTVLRPPDTRLSFALHPGDVFPGDGGMSVRITSAQRPHAPQYPRQPGERGGPEATTAEAATDGAFSRPGAGPDGATGPAPPATPYEFIHLAATLTQAGSMADIVEKAATTIMAMFQAQGLVLLMLEDGRLKTVGARGYPSEAVRRMDGARMRWRATPSSEALSRREATFFCTPEDMDAVYEGMSTLTGKAAWAYLPLIASDRPVGCCVVSYDRPRTFTSGERAFMISLAGLLAQALDRTMLHESRYRLVRSLQEGFLPSVLPEVPGLQVASRYRAAARGLDIGGDFFDLIGLSDTEAGAAIGDVQGHNAVAAALMGQVRTAVHATAGAEPADVLGRTNRLLTSLDVELFTSCLYGHIDLSNDRVRFASAGHPPPLLRHPDGAVSVVRLAPGPLLGITRTTDYPVDELPLPPGTELVMYTDGLVETPGEDPDISTARLARILAAVPAGASLETCADHLLKNVPAGPRLDDVALLLIRRH